MTAGALVAFVHHLTAFALVAALVGEHLALAAAPERRLRVLDAIYGASAGAVLVAGLLRVFYFEKGAAFYFGNAFFIAKLALFVVVGLLSIYPTVLFRRSRLDAVQLARIRTLVRLQLAGIVLILLCAALMAKGIG